MREAAGLRDRPAMVLCFGLEAYRLCPVSIKQGASGGAQDLAITQF